jgi:hypothetical protein
MFGRNAARAFRQTGSALAGMAVVAVLGMSVPGAEEQAPAAGQGGPAAQGGGRGRAGGGGRGGALRTPSALRAVPAETTAAKAKDPNWKPPRTAWGHPDLEGVWTSDDMRGVPTTRPKDQMDRESLTADEFARRAGGDEANRDRAVNQETFLRNEFGIRTFGYTSILVEPANGQMPGVTPAAAARRKAQAGVGTFGTRPLNTFEDFSLYDRCITRGIASITPVLYGNGLRIAQSPDAVTITYEMIHDTRVIPLSPADRNGSTPFLATRPRLNSNIKLWMGDARGRWEGDTLVIETTNFTDRTSIQGLHSDKLKITEWLTRVDPQMIEYRMRVEDPETWTAPFTLRYMITTQPDYPDVYEYSCHEGNTAVEHGLRSERAYEREVEEAKAKGLPVPPRVNRGMEVYGAPARSLPVRDVNSSK